MMIYQFQGARQRSSSFGHKAYRHATGAEVDEVRTLDYQQGKSFTCVTVRHERIANTLCF
jgi:hypothetical protein